MWWFPIVTVLIVILGTAALLVPEINSLVELRQSQKNALTKLSTTQKKYDQFQQMRGDDIDELYELSTSALPMHKPYYEVLSSISLLANTTGVVIGDFDLDPGSLATKAAETHKEGYVSLSTSLQVNGTAEQVTSFVQQLQKSLPLIEVKQIQISVANNASITDTRQANLDVVIYYAENTTPTFSAKESIPIFTESLQQTYNQLSRYSFVDQNVTASSGAVFNMGRSDVFEF
jgi:Tfp pilus assembly protein PilO